MAVNASEMLADVWQRNARVNDGLLDHLTPELMGLSSPGGWSVVQHLTHTAGFRKNWLAYLKKV